MGNAESYQGSCFCGAVKFKVTGEPVGMGYCHCESCRNWSAGRVNAFTLWQPQALEITEAPTTSAPITRRRTAIASGARPVAATCLPSIPEWA